MTRTMTGGEAIVEGLKAQGVDTVFGLPGAQMYPFFDALARHAQDIRTIGARHEQTCGYMAFGAARATGKPAVYSVVPGPGMLNTTAALATAWGTCTPILCVTGQVPTSYLGKKRGHLHEIPDQLGTMRSLVKWAERIERPADAPELVAEAFRQMQTGRPGPVALEMCWDTMASSEAVPAAQRAILPAPAAPDAEAVRRAIELIRDAKQPMIMVGTGAQHAPEAILRLAERLGAPVAAFRGGRGVVDETGPYGLSSYAAHKYFAQCDLLIGIGSRLEMPYMRWQPGSQRVERPQTPPVLLRIDVDPEEMLRFPPQAGIVGDCAVVVPALLAALEEAGHAPADKRAAIEQARMQAGAEIRQVQPQLDYLEVIRAALPADGFLVEELCQVGFASYFGYPVHRPRTYVSSGFQGTLGFGFPTALGVKAANPAKPVVSITGDGGLLFAVQELATARQYGIGLVTIVFNNNAYGNVRRDQEERFGNRIIGADLVNPDFMMLAKAFGVTGHRVESPAALAPVLAEALRRDQPALIEIPSARGSESSPWPFIHPARL
ncbi:MAG: hypothetical protein LCH38_02340 [Proteobacteria bacterium]|nr:hypothetical protein [Pseudomonadota bacterium]